LIHSAKCEKLISHGLGPMPLANGLMATRCQKRYFPMPFHSNLNQLAIKLKLTCHKGINALAPVFTPPPLV